MFKEIQNFNSYLINEDGVVISKQRGISYTKSCGEVTYTKPLSVKKISKRKDGYCYVTLYQNNRSKLYLLHRLIAEAFIPNPDNKPFINHIDGNPSNNSISNLEWCTPKENSQHARKTGLLRSTKGVESPLKKSVIQCDKYGNFIKKWECIRDAARSLEIKHYCIVNVCAGRELTYKGFKWAYAA